MTISLFIETAFVNGNIMGFFLKNIAYYVMYAAKISIYCYNIVKEFCFLNEKHCRFCGNRLNYLNRFGSNKYESLIPYTNRITIIKEKIKVCSFDFEEE